MPHPTLYRYFRDDKSKCQLIGTGVGKNITLMNVTDIDLWAMCWFGQTMGKIEEDSRKPWMKFRI